MTRPGIIESVQPKEKAIAFTFDDGPHPAYTPALMQLFEENGGKATFFQLGSHVEEYPELTRELLARGHEIGNHTVTHPKLSQLSEEQMREEVEGWERIYLQIAGTKPALFRPPYGNYNETTLKVVRDAGYGFVMWTEDQDPNDWDEPGTRAIIDHVLNHLKNGDIILLHDSSEKDKFSRQQTVEAVGYLLPLLRSQGYRFVTVSELLKLQ